MSLSKARTSFGAHSMSAEDRVTGLPLGIVKAIADASASLKRDEIDLFAGSNPIAIDSMEGKMDSTMSLTIKEFKPFLYTLAGYTVTELAANTTGVAVGIDTFAGQVPKTAISAVTPIGKRKMGSLNTIDSATNGLLISTPDANKADLKDGKYVIIATGTPGAVNSIAFDIYCFTDIYFGEGASVTYSDDLLKVGSISNVCATEQVLTGFGIGFTKAGTLALTVGDTATFEIRAPHAKSYEYKLTSAPSPIEFGMHLYSQKKGTDEYFEDYFPRVKLGGIPAGIKENEWQNLTLTAKIMFDEVAGFSHKRKDLVRSNS